MDVVHYLQLLCSNEVDIPIGGILHTGMQNERGGYENDCMLVRQSKKRYDLPSRIISNHVQLWNSRRSGPNPIIYFHHNSRIVLIILPHHTLRLFLHLAHIDLLHFLMFLVISWYHRRVSRREFSNGWRTIYHLNRWSI